jgi:hypothetical protein
MGATTLQFRVMRLPRPTLELETPLRFAPEDLLGACVPAESLPRPTSEAFERRLDLFAAEDASGLSGMLVLPQSFGVVHLGETFASYVSVANHTDRVARDVGVKVELQTQRRRVALFDNTATPLSAIQPGASYDFIVEYDLKELGAHTLACTVGYSEDVPAGAPGGADRRRHPQHFKFDVANPIAVRTKVRQGRDGATFLEACVENATKTPLLLSAATFEPAPRFTCDAIVPPKSAGANGSTIPDGARAGGGVGLPSLEGRDLLVLDASGGSAHFLFELRENRAGHHMKVSSVETAFPADALGKLEIRWRGRMGETGRLQTQQILGAPKPETAGDVELALDPESRPSTAILAMPVYLQFIARNTNATSTTPPLELVVLDDDETEDARANPPAENGAQVSNCGDSNFGSADGRMVIDDSSSGMAVDGMRAVPLGRLAPGASACAVVTVVPLLPGARRTPRVVVRESADLATGTRSGRIVGYMRGIEIMVGRG